MAKCLEVSRAWLVAGLAVSIVLPPCVPPVAAQPAAVQQPAGAEAFSVQQLDALLAPVALYPDQLLTQVLMAATFPLQVVEAARWREDPAHAALGGDALAQALAPLAWDPSVKSLVPFPQVLSQLNGNLEWTQQLGYAFATQQREVMDSVQRLRRQAQAQGQLQSSPQQVVRLEPASDVVAASSPQTIIIEPADPQVVYVPSYNPAVVYGTWPYPAYPPVAAAPAPGYVAGTALLSGLAFGAGVAITAGLWGWSRPNWSRGDVNINVNRWNTINVNRQRAVSNTWSPTLNRSSSRAYALQRPPAGPVGAPVRNAGLPPNAVGRPNVGVPASAVNRPPPRPAPPRPEAGPRPNLSPGSRPAARPPAPPPTAASRPGFQDGRLPPGGDRAPAPRPVQGAPQRAQQRAQQRPPQGPPAFSGLPEGGRAAAYSQRGAQSFQGGGSQRGGGPAREGGRGGFRGR
ncbi:conserved protein of unknown function [Rhodovastum atsumiense]|uniref:DUF3300 domain-containing protein n=1 Tax=Rhodovastum atsumiense TaxID=504468 RepID=A0A5M6IQ51_9PROT|nr:DUF3300 domain-containing protein [Rhodovastum atsumiense]KAA5610386.1 DUF3300 domain-containing protein [Rhodovastum atsumiense]CAH2602937.1 conserved protein of unknown function [Rhodovastum atsumiense]